MEETIAVLPKGKRHCLPLVKLHASNLEVAESDILGSHETPAALSAFDRTQYAFNQIDRYI